MFNVRPEALAPWLHVEPLPADEVPGFRMNPDGSVRDTQRGAASGSLGFDPSASPSPLTGFQDAMGFSGNIDADAYLTGGPTDFAASPRNPLQDALDEITRIYARFVPRPSGPFDGQGAGTAKVSSSGSQQLSPYAAGSQTSEPLGAGRLSTAGQERRFSDDGGTLGISWQQFRPARPQGHASASA